MRDLLQPLDKDQGGGTADDFRVQQVNGVVLHRAHGVEGHPLLFFLDAGGFAGPHGGDEDDIGVLDDHLFPAVDPGVLMGRNVDPPCQADEFMDKGVVVGRVQGLDADLDEYPPGGGGAGMATFSWMAATSFRAFSMTCSAFSRVPVNWPTLRVLVQISSNVLGFWNFTTGI